MTPKEPKTNGEWQDAVNLAEAALHLDSARKYGLVTGGPGVNVERCEEILKRGKALGILPQADCVEKFIAATMHSPPSSAA